MLEHDVITFRTEAGVHSASLANARHNKHDRCRFWVSETLIVSMDHALMGNKTNIDVDDDEGENKYGIDDKDETHAKLRIMKDAKSRVHGAAPVPRKGADNDDGNVKEILRLLQFLVCINVLLKTDQERAPFRRVRSH